MPLIILDLKNWVIFIYKSSESVYDDDKSVSLELSDVNVS